MSSCMVLICCSFKIWIDSRENPVKTSKRLSSRLARVSGDISSGEECTVSSELKVKHCSPPKAEAYWSALPGLPFSTKQACSTSAIRPQTEPWCACKARSRAQVKAEEEPSPVPPGISAMLQISRYRDLSAH